MQWKGEGQRCASLRRAWPPASASLRLAASSRAAAASERSAADATRTAWLNAFCAAMGDWPPLADALAACYQAGRVVRNNFETVVGNP